MHIKRPFVQIKRACVQFSGCASIGFIRGIKRASKGFTRGIKRQRGINRAYEGHQMGFRRADNNYFTCRASFIYPGYEVLHSAIEKRALGGEKKLI